MGTAQDTGGARMEKRREKTVKCGNGVHRLPLAGRSWFRRFLALEKRQDLAGGATRGCFLTDLHSGHALFRPVISLEKYVPLAGLLSQNTPQSTHRASSLRM
jgi:hypothetical protein